ncbi:MAG: glycosyltransferase [Sphingomonadales bacterium]|nr:MAG: glycosyltransferase [Sphingomonadales bacterium]
MSFDCIDPSAAAARVMALAKSDMFTYVVTPNVDHIVQLHRSGDPILPLSYDNAALCLCDSRILAGLAYLSGLNLPVVTGSDLTFDLVTSRLKRGKLLVIGGNAALHMALASAYPRFDWHFYEPPMGVRHDPLARNAIAEFVEATAANVTFFAIGAPQSEMVCADILLRGRARGVALCVGASLEFLTRAKVRAPRWMQRPGLEWLFRLVSEPRRLWRRYLLDGPRIFVIWQRWRHLNSARLRASSGSSASGFE